MKLQFTILTLLKNLDPWVGCAIWTLEVVDGIITHTLPRAIPWIRSTTCESNTLIFSSRLKLVQKELNDELASHSLLSSWKTLEFFSFNQMLSHSQCSWEHCSKRHLQRASPSWGLICSITFKGFTTYVVGTFAWSENHRFEPTSLP